MSQGEGWGVAGAPVDEERFGPYFGATGTGVTLGVLAMFVPWLPWTLGPLFMSVVHRKLVGLAALAGTYLFWQGTVSGLAAQRVSGEGIDWSRIGDMFAFFRLIGALLVACLCYWAGTKLRPLRSTPWPDWAGVFAGIVSCIVLTGTLLVVPPATSSFQFSLPQGWSVADTGQEFGPGGAGSCREYLAVRGDPATSLSPLSSPVLCVTVGELQPGDSSPASEQCYHLEDLGGVPPLGLYRWPAVDGAPAPAIPGAHEEIRMNPSGGPSHAVVYGLGLFTTRWLGPAQDSVCYLISLTLPDEAAMSNAEVSALLGTFQLR